MANRRRRRSNARVSSGARQGTKQQQKNFMKYGLGAVSAIVVVAAVVIAVASSSGSSGEGEQAQDFDFSLFQGIEEIGFREGNLASLHGRGKPMVLNFWAGLCPPCRAEMPQFQVFYEEFKEDIQLLGIDIGIFTGLGSHDAADDLLRELGVRYPAGWTDDGSVPRKFGVTGMPTTVFISSDGTIMEKSVGAIDANFLARASRELLAAEAEAAAGMNHGG